MVIGNYIIYPCNYNEREKKIGLKNIAECKLYAGILVHAQAHYTIATGRT